MEKFGGHTMAEIKAAARAVDSTPELRRKGAELVQAAKDDRKKRSDWAKKDIDATAKDLARHIVHAPVSFAAPSELYRTNYQKIDWTK